MNLTRIEQLARLLPATECHGHIPTPRLAGRLSTAANDPAFGHQFVMDYVRRGEALPAAVYEHGLRRAHNHYAGLNVIEDILLLHVEQLALTSNESTRQVVNALLVCRDATFAQIAGWLQMDEPVIRLYEQLHFNVRDRLADQAYLARIVFPNGGRIRSLKTDSTSA